MSQTQKENVRYENQKGRCRTGMEPPHLFPSSIYQRPPPPAPRFDMKF